MTKTLPRAVAWAQNPGSPIGEEPTLAELREAFPREWATVSTELGSLNDAGEDEIAAYLATLTAPLPAVRPGSARSDERLLVSLRVQRLMAASALRSASIAAATGVTRGTVRFNLFNGYLAQRLLFEHDLVRKPVSARWFALLWPLVWQRRRLMPLVQPKGIYCFYTRQLVDELASLIGNRRCLEIGAGDGTLARFLGDVGVDVLATDDYSWKRDITYPRNVLRQDAATALRGHAPEVVLCSWPPCGNSFERRVFTTPSVQTYIVINGPSDRVSGNWSDYERQTAFEWERLERLGKLVLPRTLHATIHRFERSSAHR